MHALAESSHHLAGQAGKINGHPIDAALVVDEHHIDLSTIIARIAQDSARGSRLSREGQGSAEELAAAYRRMNEHLAVVSHELRNALGAIRYAARGMRMKQREPAAVEKAGLIIEDQVGQMARCIDDLFEVSLLKSGRLCLQCARVDLRVVARRAIENVELEIGRRNQRLTVVLPEAPVWLHADPSRLAQVLVNLLSNATKYTDNGGELQLSVEREAGGAAIRVRDSGIGIAWDVLPHVFEPFMQAQSSLPRSEKGVGIGLALVSSLVELHGGRVAAASAGLGRGSEFTVYLPATAA